MKRSSGETVWVEQVVKVFTDGQDVAGLRGAFVDITDRKLLEGQYLHAQKMEAVGTLTGGIAHDFNNLLTTIVANLDNAARQIRLLPSSEQSTAALEQVNGATDASRRATATVRQLLAFSRKDTPNQTPIRFNDVVRSATKLLTPAMDAGILIKQELSSTEPVIMGNAAQLENMILNLCNNSRDAMPDGGEIILSTSLGLHAGKDVVIFRVIDNGQGMSAQAHERAFEPFFTTKSVDRGSGLGLAMCYAVVKQHDGSIQCESAVGHGTAIEVAFPAISAGGAEEVKVTEPNDEENPFPQPLSVLVVDDEPTVLQAVVALLEGYGLKTYQANNGEEALSLVQTDDTIDVVLLDRTMPRLDGWQTLQELQLLRPSLPVVLCSGYANTEEQRPGDAQPAGVLQKPFHLGDLARVIREVTE